MPETEKLSGDILVERAEALVPVIAAGAAERDRKRLLPAEQVDLVRAAGVPTATIGTKFGGPGAKFIHLAKIVSMLSSADPNVSQSFLPHFAMLDFLRVFGTEQQQQRWFGRILAGGMFGNAYSERGTKHALDMKTTIRKSGSGYRVDGKKFYCTGSAFCDWIFAPVVNDTGDVVLAIFPKEAAGVTIVDDCDAMGQKTTASGTIELNDDEVDPDDVIAIHDFATDRSFVGAGAQLRHAAIDVGIAVGALRDAITFGRTKARPSASSGVSNVAEDPYVLHVLGEVAVVVHASEAMLERAAMHLDRGVAVQMNGAQANDVDQILGEASITVAEAKAMANQASLGASQMMFQIGGTSMALGSLNYDRHWRNARTHTIHDPVSYKYRTIGNFHLTGALPPISIYS
jgi:SfnB family sulfur acquisition oxidoreductase